MQACRRVDRFFANVAGVTPPNKNVELGGRDGFKLFPRGVTHWVRNERRINGGWHVAIARHMHVFFATTDVLPEEDTTRVGEAYSLLLVVHQDLRNPVEKNAGRQYQGAVNDLLQVMVHICADHSPSRCHSIKYHWPRHWWDTRRELGCAAAEKSLERKLGEVQKRNYQYTNGRCDVEVRYCDMSKRVAIIMSN